MPSDPNVQALKNVPQWGQFLFNAFRNLQTQLSNSSLQTNANLKASQAAPPPQINALNVVASGGVAHVQITDNNEGLYRGVNYHVQYALAGTGFKNPVTQPMGPSRDIRIPVGTQPLEYRAFSDYPTSAHSEPVYHGGATPIAVAATGTDQPPIPSGMGSGTGTPSQISGFGPVPWRGVNPPKRG
jgi:hypothetical protein